MSDGATTSILGLTTQIMVAYVAKNKLGADTLPALIQSVYRSLSTAGDVESKPQAQAPAVPVRKSVFPDFIVCLEDGKKLRMLKRHLRTCYNLTPEDYRTKWGLPHDYPMVAPSYASHRSVLAKKFGLGRKPLVAEPLVEIIPTRRARP